MPDADSIIETHASVTNASRELNHRPERGSQGKKINLNLGDSSMSISADAPLLSASRVTAEFACVAAIAAREG